MSHPPTTNLIIAGVGGQGVLMISEMIALAAVEAGFDAKQTEVHGVSQRGGSVHSHVRFGPRIHSPLVPIGQADLVIGLEKLEALRFAPYLRPAGVILLNNHAVPPLSAGEQAVEGYPHAAAQLLRGQGLRVLDLPATELAERDLGNAKVANLIMVGLASTLLPIPREVWAALLQARVPPRFLDLNRRAFDLGARLAGEIARGTPALPAAAA